MRRTTLLLAAIVATILLSSGVASKELGRFFVGAEKEEEYAELAGHRIGAALRGEVLRALRNLDSVSHSG